MVADVCRWYSYTSDDVIYHMSNDQFILLWSRGRIAEVYQAMRIAGFMNGVSIDEKIEEQKARETRDAIGEPDWGLMESLPEAE